jgi:hypothetical protein
MRFDNSSYYNTSHRSPDSVRSGFHSVPNLLRLCEKPLTCHREDPRRVLTGISTRRVVPRIVIDESSTDEVGRRGDLKNSKERARLIRSDKKHRDLQ